MSQYVNEDDDEPHQIPDGPDTMTFLFGGKTPNGATMHVVNTVYSDDEQGKNGTFKVEIKVIPAAFGLRDIMNAYERKRFDLLAPGLRIRKLKQEFDMFFDRLFAIVESNEPNRSLVLLRLNRLVQDKGPRIKSLLAEMAMMEK